MTTEVKVQAYQDAWNSLSKKKEISNLYYPEEKKNFDLKFNVSDVECLYSLYSNVDMLKIEAVKIYENKTEVELSQIIENLMKDTTDIRCTYYDNKIKFLANVVFTGTEDSAAKPIVDKMLEDFVSFLIANFYVEPEEEEITDDDSEGELLEEEEEIKAETVVYATTEYEDVEKVKDFRDSSLPERHSKKVSDIHFPSVEDLEMDEFEENDKNDAIADIMKGFSLPEINHVSEPVIPAPQEPITPVNNLFVSNSQTDLEIREKNLLIKTRELEQKEAQLRLKEEEVSRLYANIEPQKRDIEAKYAQIEQDKLALENAKKDLEERARAIAQSNVGGGDKVQVAKLHAYIKELKANEADYEKDLENYENAYKQLQNTYEALKVDSNDKIKTLNERVLQLQNDNIENVKKGNSENERLSGIIEEKNHEITRLENEKLDLLAQIKEKEEELNSRSREIDHLQNKISELPVILPINKIKESLSEEGIEMDIVVGDGGDILVCENYNNCKIVVNCNLTIFYITKAIKKPLKYTGQVNTYNEEDIRYTFMVGNDNISCKGIYQDAPSEIKACLEKFDSFKA